MRPERTARRTTSRWQLPLVLSLALAACGGGGTPTDQTAGFVGVWTFSSGSLAATCTGIPAPAPFELTGLSVTFAKVDDSTISLTAGSAGCTVDFGVTGDIAKAKPNQTCVLALGKSFGNQTVAVQTWMLTRTGDRIDSNVTGAVLFCSVSGTGVLTRGSLDASAPDASALDGAAGAAGDEGGAGADGSAGGAAGGDGAAGAGDTLDAAPDAASDVAPSPDAGAGDAPTEAGADATTETGD
jgi:hypothetical protein